MVFMMPEITERIEWYMYETDLEGTVYVPVEDLTEYGHCRKMFELEAYHVEKVEGHGVRLSAPGYMDCTEWAVFDTEKECREYLRDMDQVCDCCGSNISEPEDVNERDGKEYCKNCDNCVS